MCRLDGSDLLKVLCKKRKLLRGPSRSVRSAFKLPTMKLKTSCSSTAAAAARPGTQGPGRAPGASKRTSHSAGTPPPPAVPRSGGACPVPAACHRARAKQAGQGAQCARQGLARGSRFGSTVERPEGPDSAAGDSQPGSPSGEAPPLARHLPAAAPPGTGGQVGGDEGAGRRAGSLQQCIAGGSTTRGGALHKVRAVWSRRLLPGQRRPAGRLCCRQQRASPHVGLPLRGRQPQLL